MLSRDARDIIGDILNLFMQACKIPITLHELGDDGSVQSTIFSEKNFFPRHCQAMWQLNGHRGQIACQEDMCVRAKSVALSGKTESRLCHAGLTNVAEPIIVDGKVVAAINYGAFVANDEQDFAERLDRHRQAMRTLGVSESEAAHIRELLVNHTPRHSLAEWEWARQTLPSLISRVLYQYVNQKEHDSDVQQKAYHDLQQRLQSVLANAESLMTGLPADSPGRERAEDIIGAVEAAGTVIHGATRGQYLPEQYRFKRHSIRSFIDKALILCRAEARKKGIEIKIDLYPPGDSLTLQASQEHLQLAFNNLLHNAVKYSYRTTSESSSRYVEICGRVWRGGYEIVISNYGVGIDPGEYESIFTEGYRGKLTKADYRSGTGQGLALAKRVIDKHHGTICPVSIPVVAGALYSDGTIPYLTRFTVWLPFRQPN